MFRSMRWTLQLWHAAILLVALISFGIALYVTTYQTQMEHLDSELEAAVRTIASLPPIAPRQMQEAHAASTQRMQEMVPSMFDEPMPQGGGLPLPSWEAEPRNGRDGGMGWGPDGGKEAQQTEWWEQVRQDALRRLGQDEKEQSYFVIWSFDGKVLRSSLKDPEIPLPTGWVKRDFPVGMLPPGIKENRDVSFRDRGSLREVSVSGPFGSTVLVGKSRVPELAAMQHLRWILYGVGAVVMGVGLCGGWWLASRALRPIAQISGTAKAISGSDLAQRIEMAETQNELGSLAQTLNEMFERLETAFQRQVRFTADASHELRTPLSVIYAQAELTLSQERTAEEYKNALQSCLRSAKRMKNLVEMLLMLARADAGKMVLQRENFNLREAIQECVSLVEVRAQERNVALVYQPEDCFIDADRTRVLQLLTNLLVNAITYNRPGGSVTVMAEKKGTMLELSISDTGIGISAADQVHLFERFFRADKARSREAGGSGLGLAICQSIVEAHGGDILFRSQQAQPQANGSTGESGTTFTVRLPLYVPGDTEPGANT